MYSGESENGNRVESRVQLTALSKISLKFISIIGYLKCKMTYARMPLVFEFFLGSGSLEGSQYYAQIVLRSVLICPNAMYTER